jgi:hypothetical protein
MGKTWKPVVSGILAIIGGCMGIAGGISIIIFGMSLVDMPSLYDEIGEMIQRASTLGMSMPVASGLGAIPFAFGIMAIIGGYHALEEWNGAGHWLVLFWRYR